MYSMVTIVNNTLAYLKVAKKITKVFIIRKKICNNV